MELGVSGVPGAHAPKQNSATEEPKFALVCVTVPLLKTVESFAQGLDPKARNVQKQIAKVLSIFEIFLRTYQEMVYFTSFRVLKSLRADIHGVV